MMDTILKNDAFFSGEHYRAQKGLFLGLDLLLNEPYAIIKSDASRRFIFAQMNEAAPIWIWTEPMTSQALCEEISKVFYANYAHREALTVIARPQVGAYIATYFSKMKNLSWHIGMKFEAFQILKDTLANPCANRLFKLTNLDDDILGQVVLNVPPENRSQLFKRLYQDREMPVIESEELYVYMADGQIQGTLSIDLTHEHFAKLSDIFLFKNVRGQKLGRQIIMDACQIVQKKQMQPVLFTERFGGYTRMLMNDSDFEHLGSLDEIIIYK